MKKLIKFEGYIFLVIFGTIFAVFTMIMGLSNFFSTLTSTAYYLLIEVVWYIMAIAVLTSALAGLLSEFKVIDIFNKVLSPFMHILYKLPGVASLGIITTYLSDNPAIISLVSDKKFRKNFNKQQLPALCNLGTSFGMGLIVSTTMIGYDKSFFTAVIIGNICAVIGSIVSVRIMNYFTKRRDYDIALNIEEEHQEETHVENLFERIINAMLDGGKNGVQIGLEIIPGVLVISTLIMLLTFGEPVTGYDGGLQQGIGLLPYLGNKISFILTPLFGFSSPEAIAFPITALGSTGAALGLVEGFLVADLISQNDIAVFVAMGMTWSGYLATHIAMMDSLGTRVLTKYAIIAHTFGGIFAGIFANYLFLLVSSF